MAAVTAHVTQRAEVSVVALGGELTAATVLRLESCLAPLFKRARPIVVIDLSRLTTCDSTGVLMLTVAAHVATDVDGEVRLAGPTGPVCRAMRAGDTMRRVPTFGTLEGALRADPLDLLATQVAWAVTPQRYRTRVLVYVGPASRRLPVSASPSGSSTWRGGCLCSMYPGTSKAYVNNSRHGTRPAWPGMTATVPSTSTFRAASEDSSAAGPVEPATMSSHLADPVRRIVLAAREVDHRGRPSGIRG